MGRHCDPIRTQFINLHRRRVNNSVRRNHLSVNPRPNEGSIEKNRHADHSHHLRLRRRSKCRRLRSRHAWRQNRRNWDSRRNPSQLIILPHTGTNQPHVHPGHRRRRTTRHLRHVIRPILLLKRGCTRRMQQTCNVNRFRRRVIITQGARHIPRGHTAVLLRRIRSNVLRRRTMLLRVARGILLRYVSRLRERGRGRTIE